MLKDSTLSMTPDVIIEDYDKNIHENISLFFAPSPHPSEGSSRSLLRKVVHCAFYMVASLTVPRGPLGGRVLIGFPSGGVPHSHGSLGTSGDCQRPARLLDVYSHNPPSRSVERLSLGSSQMFKAPFLNWADATVQKREKARYVLGSPGGRARGGISLPRAMLAMLYVSLMSA